MTLFPLAEVDLSVLLVEDEDVPEVTGSEGREGLEVVAERGPCRRRVSLARHIGRHQEIHTPATTCQRKMCGLVSNWEEKIFA